MEGQQINTVYIGGDTEADYDNFHWIFRYNDNILKLIHLLKYSGKRKLIHRILEYKKSEIIKIRKFSTSDFIIPVPLHRVRMLERGYNQSLLIGREVSEVYNIPLSENILFRTKNNRSQTGLSKEERIKNVRGIFRVKEDVDLTGKKLLLVDDILTTGATINECVKTLKKNGAKKVDVLTLAYAERDLYTGKLYN